MERLAPTRGSRPAAFKQQVERAGRRLAVRSDLKKSKAFDWLVEHAEVTDEEGNPVDRALLQRDSQKAADNDLPGQPARMRHRRVPVSRSPLRAALTPALAPRTSEERPGDNWRCQVRVVSQYHVPGIFEQTNRGERGYDLFSRMLEENIVFLGTPIDDYVANAVCAQLLYLEYKNPDKDISIYINSPGGDITALFAVYDTMKFVRNDISTFCYGQAASAAAVILAGGTKGKRYALPHARILLHQPYGGAAGQAADIEIQAKEIVRMRDLLNEMIALDTGQTLDKVASDTDRDFIMSAAEAQEYGIIDEVITTRELAGVPQAAGVA